CRVVLRLFLRGGEAALAQRHRKMARSTDMRSLAAGDAAILTVLRRCETAPTVLRTPTQGEPAHAGWAGVHAGVQVSPRDLQRRPVYRVPGPLGVELTAPPPRGQGNFILMQRHPSPACTGGGRGASPGTCAKKRAKFRPLRSPSKTVRERPCGKRGEVSAAAACNRRPRGGRRDGSNCARSWQAGLG